MPAAVGLGSQILGHRDFGGERRFIGRDLPRRDEFARIFSGAGAKNLEGDFDGRDTLAMMRFGATTSPFTPRLNPDTL